MGSSSCVPYVYCKGLIVHLPYHQHAARLTTMYAPVHPLTNRYLTRGPILLYLRLVGHSIRCLRPRPDCATGLLCLCNVATSDLQERHTGTPTERHPLPRLGPTWCTPRLPRPSDPPMQCFACHLVPRVRLPWTARSPCPWRAHHRHPLTPNAPAASAPTRSCPSPCCC